MHPNGASSPEGGPHERIFRHETVHQLLGVWLNQRVVPHELPFSFGGVYCFGIGCGGELKLKSQDKESQKGHMHWHCSRWMG
jgi:hypothetical protein